MESPRPQCRSCHQSLSGLGGPCPECGGAAAVFEGLDGFEILAVLGKGGMGTVYRARDTTLEREVAIKAVAPGFAEDEPARRRFLREAKIMATVEHPHIVRIYAFVHHDPFDFLVMEYVRGETLAEIVKRAPLPWPEAVRVLRQVVSALAAAAERGVVHRDVKPSNILLGPGGTVRVSDFGLSKSVGSESDLTASGAFLGTPHYVAPEQMRGEAVDFRSDVYALGISLFEVLVGERPFEESSPFVAMKRYLTEPLPGLLDRCPTVPAALDQLYRAMTAPRPEDRPDSYRALEAALAELDRGEGATVLQASSRLEAREWNLRRWLPLALVVLVIVAIALVVRLGQGGTAGPTGGPNPGRGAEAGPAGTAVSADAHRAYLAGKDAFRQLYYEEALEDLHRAVELDPDHFEAHLLLSNVYDALGESDLAASSAARAVELASELSEVDQLRARRRAAQVAGDLDVELDLLEKLVVLDPTNGMWPARRAWFLHTHEARCPESLGYYRRALRRLGPENSDVWAYYGEALLGCGEPQRAVEALEAYVELEPESADSHCSLGGVYVAVGRYDDAELEIGAAEAYREGHAPCAAVRGDLLAARGALGKAIEAYQEYLEQGLGSNSAEEALASIAILDLALERPRRALELAQAAHGADPSSALGLWILGLAEVANGALDQARHQASLLDLLLERSGSHHREELHHHLRGAIARAEGDPRAAAASFELACRHWPTDRTFFQLDLATAWADAEAWSEAEEVLTDLLAFNPEHAAGRALLGRVLEAQGRIEEADREYTRALSIWTGPATDDPRALRLASQQLGAAPD